MLKTARFKIHRHLFEAVLDKVVSAFLQSIYGAHKQAISKCILRMGIPRWFYSAQGKQETRYWGE